MKILIINPRSNLTEEERDYLRNDLARAIRSGVILTSPDIISYEVVEFDSIEMEHPKRNDRRDILKAYLKDTRNKEEKPNDNSGNDEKDS